jgi:hypothetical protein
VAGHETAPTGVVVAVSCLPVLVLGMGAGLGHMLSRDVQARRPAETVTAVTESATVGVSPTVEPESVTADTLQVHAPDVPAQVTGVKARDTSINPAELAERPTDSEVQPGPVPEPVSEPDPLYPVAVRAFFSDVAQGSAPPVREIKSRLGVGTDRARRLQAHLAYLIAEAAR